MGSFQHTPQNSKHTQFFSKMKVQFILAACLAAAAFAAPMPNQFIDPDCIEEDLVVEEPSQEINADFALGLPDLRLDFGENEPTDEDCVDDDVTEPVPVAATEECEDPIETTVAPEPKVEEAECEDPITTEAPQTESEAAECEEPSEAPPTEPSCEEGEGEENAPAIDIRIEPAGFVQDIKVYGDEQMIPDIEECEE